AAATPTRERSLRSGGACTARPRRPRAVNLHLWNGAAVARDLAAGRIDQRASMHYRVALALLLTLAGCLAALAMPPATGLLAYQGFVVLLISAIGVRACYYANGGPAGRDFVLRFTCLSVPMLVQLGIASAALLALLHWQAVSWEASPRSRHLLGFLVVA